MIMENVIYRTMILDSNSSNESNDKSDKYRDDESNDIMIDVMTETRTGMVNMMDDADHDSGAITMVQKMIKTKRMMKMMIVIVILMVIM